MPLEEYGPVPRRAKTKRLVFVSHSSRDTWIARQIAREISNCGATPFLDEAEIDVGADFEEDILAFLEKADELIVLLHGITVGELQSKPGAPVFLKKRNLIDLNDIAKYLAQLKKRVRK